MTAGEILRQARVRAGLDLDTLARGTRISRRYLEAIEADNPSGVPGQFFYRSFVKQYAEALGLDPADVGQELPAAPAPPVYRTPLREAQPILTPVSSGRRLGGRTTTWVSVLALVAVIAGCSALYAWYRSRQSAPTVVAQSTQAAEPAPAPVTQPPAPVTTPTQPPPAEQQPAQPAPAPTATETTPNAAPVPSPDDKVYIAVSSKEKAWVSLMSDGKQVFAGTLEPGQVKTAGGKERARLRVGNAGGVDVTYNGKAIGPIGAKGQVRTVVFTPRGFQILKLNMEDDDSGT